MNKNIIQKKMKKNHLINDCYEPYAAQRNEKRVIKYLMM